MKTAVLALCLGCAAAGKPSRETARRLGSPKQLVDTAHPLLKARWEATGKLTLADIEAAAAAPEWRTERAVRGRDRVSRLGSINDDRTAADCAAYTGSGAACFDGDQSYFDDDFTVALAPGACATCGYSDSAPSGGNNDFRDCITCADAAYELMVLFRDCTGVCVDAAGKATLEASGFADLDDSACEATRACYDDDGFVDSLALGGTNANFIDDDDGYSYSYSYSYDPFMPCPDEESAYLTCVNAAAQNGVDASAGLGWGCCDGGSFPTTCAGMQTYSEFQDACGDPAPECAAEWTTYVECVYATALDEINNDLYGTAPLECDLSCNPSDPTPRPVAAAAPTPRPTLALTTGVISKAVYPDTDPTCSGPPVHWIVEAPHFNTDGACESLTHPGDGQTYSQSGSCASATSFSNAASRARGIASNTSGKRSLISPMKTTMSSSTIFGRLKSRRARISSPASGWSGSPRLNLPAWTSTDLTARSPQS